jgi:hypothetical protein
MNNEDETAYRGLMTPELAQAVAAVLKTFPGAKLIAVRPHTPNNDTSEPQQQQLTFGQTRPNRKQRSDHHD